METNSKAHMLAGTAHRRAAKAWETVKDITDESQLSEPCKMTCIAADMTRSFKQHHQIQMLDDKQERLCPAKIAENHNTAADLHACAYRHALARETYWDVKNVYEAISIFNGLDVNYYPGNVTAIGTGVMKAALEDLTAKGVIESNDALHQDNADIQWSRELADMLNEQSLDFVSFEHKHRLCAVAYEDLLNSAIG